MSRNRIQLKPEEAAVILRTDEKNVDAQTKRLLQKVVDKRPLSEEELGALEGIVANEMLRKKYQAHALQPGEDTPDAKKTRNTFRAIEQDIVQAARRRVVFELRNQHPPFTVREIADKMGIATDTVIRDLRAIRDQHNKVLDGSATIRILGHTCEQYDVLHGKAMALAELYTSPMAKAAFLRTAISALDSKAKLMGETGIIHRVPERQEILVAHADAGTVRDRVARLVHAQEHRTSKTIELPAPRAVMDEPLVDADLSEAEAPQADDHD